MKAFQKAKYLPIFWFIILSIAVASCTHHSNVNDLTDATVQTIPNSLETIISDMLLPHEGRPNGLPNSSDWAFGPRLSYGNNPPTNWLAMIPAAQVYRDTNPILTTNTQVEIKNIQAWYLSKRDTTWKKWVQTSEIDGAYYLEDFADDVNEPASIELLPTEGVAVQIIEGYNFHFWSKSGRVSINPNDILGVWTSVEGRIGLIDLAKEDDRDKANFMMSMAGDYWLSLTAEWDYFRTNGDIGIGRFRYLTKEWQSFNMHSVPESLLNAYPPPF